MFIAVNGFNRFNQLCYLQAGLQHQSGTSGFKNLSLVNTLLNLRNNICELTVVNPCSLDYNFLFSWSYCIFYNKDTIWVCGFLDDKSNSVTALKVPNGNTIQQVSCNRRQILCVTDDGCCWQYNIKTGMWKDMTLILQTEVSNEESSRDFITKVSCGEIVTAVLTLRGEVYNFPNKLSLSGVKIKDIDCGRGHILMLSENGEVFSVGEGSRGQLGHGELEAEEEPRLVEGLAGLIVVAVACGGWHSCAVTVDGDLYSWGWNMCGQLGLKTTKTGSGVSVQALPMVVDWPNNQEVRITSVACGARHTVTLTEDGAVWGCGWNGYGQLSIPGVDSVDEMTRIAVPEGGPVCLLQCGPWNTSVITQ